MPYFFIRTVNASFKSRDGGANYETAEEAMKSGSLAALAIVADEMRSGLTAASVEITIEDRNGAPVSRAVMSMAFTQLLTVEGRP